MRCDAGQGIVSGQGMLDSSVSRRWAGCSAKLMARLTARLASRRRLKACQTERARPLQGSGLDRPYRGNDAGPPLQKNRCASLAVQSSL